MSFIVNQSACEPLFLSCFFFYYFFSKFIQSIERKQRECALATVTT